MIDVMVLSKSTKRCEVWFMDDEAECGVVFDYVDRGGPAQEVVADFLCDAMRKPEFINHWCAVMAESEVPNLQAVVRRMVDESECESEGDWVAREFNCYRKEA